MGWCSAEQAREVLGYLIALRLLQKPGEREGQLRFPLDPLADHLAALEPRPVASLMAKAQPPLRNLYPQIISFPVLLAAFRKAAKGKRRDMARGPASLFR